MRALRSFHQWMFGYGSPVTLGAFRIIFASLTFVNLAMVAIDFDAWYTENGFVPIELLHRWNGGMPRFGLLDHVTNPHVTAVFYGLTMLAALLTAVGLFTRVSSIALLVGIISIHHRNPDILHSGDTLVRAMLVYIAVAPSGASCSLDRLIGLWRGTAPKELEPVSLWPQRMMQLQIAIVYFTTVWQKSFGDLWLNGTATHYVLHLKEFDRFPIPGFADHQPMVAITTYGTLLIELAMGTLVFSKPLRKWVLIGGLLLHGGIEYRFNIPMFAFIICSCYITFYEGDEVAGWFARLGERFKKYRLKVAAPAALKEGPELALEAADPLHLVNYTRGAGDDWVVEQEQSGAKVSTFAVLKRSMGLWPLVVFPPAWGRMLSSSTERQEAAVSAD
ncbi:MAG TPA: HTTM domain-containing protein [Fimbriimonadaceae bacterium]|nr:HTTM domain-containing protein [Fimbriimonadaceae bacterium]